MITPSTYEYAVLLAIGSMICWGSWANTLKLTGRWRFELYYFDFAIGFLITAMLAAVTFGSMGPLNSVADNLDFAGNTQKAYALAGGAIFNLANMLLVAAISMAGLAVAFPVGIGLALAVGVFWNYLLNPHGDAYLLAGGVVLVVAGMAVNGMAYGAYAAQKRRAAQPAAPEAAGGGKTRPAVSGKGVRPPAKKDEGPPRALLLCLAGGFLMGSFYPLVTLSMTGEVVKLTPYTSAAMFAIGVFLSTFVFSLYFMNLPVQGSPVKPAAYLSGTMRQHLLGMLGGAVWCVGAVCNFVASVSPEKQAVGPAISFGIGQGAVVVSALWGLFAWREFAGAGPAVRTRLIAMTGLFAAGIAMLCLAAR